MAKYKKEVLTVPSTRGKTITYCKCHAYLIEGHKWYITAQGYAARSTWKPRRMLYMHRVIVSAPKGKIVDHINGDELYNVCWNLRVGSQHDNIGNADMWKHNTSGFRGVTWSKQAGKWRAYIVVMGKQKHLGFYEHIEDAAVARRKGATEAWGEFAKESQ